MNPDITKLLLLLLLSGNGGRTKKTYREHQRIASIITSITSSDSLLIIKGNNFRYIWFWKCFFLVVMLHSYCL